jgi:hypothetical protein
VIPGRTRAGALAVVAAFALAALPGDAAADARPYLAFGPLRKGRPALMRQLRQAVCAAAECVPWGAVAEGRSFHVARARAAGIAGVLVGSVERSGGRPLLTLLLFVDDRRPAATWRLALTRQGLASGRDVRELVAALERRLLGAAAPEVTVPPARAPTSAARGAAPAADSAPEGARIADRSLAGADDGRAGAAAAPASPPSATFAPVPSPSPSPSPSRSPSSPSSPSPPAPMPVPAPPRLVDPSDTGDARREPAVMRLPAVTFSGSGPAGPGAAARSAPEEPRPVVTDAPWLAVEAGVVFARSALTFQGATASPGPLRGHEIPALVAPRLGVELQPGAWFTAGALAGFSLQGRLAMAVGAQTDVTERSHETSVSWASAGLAWRSAPPLGPRTSVSAAVSWERREVTVDPPVAGLADRRLSGGKVALGVTLPLGRASLFARAGYVAWLDAPDLIAGRTPFFPGGRAWGLDADAGLALRVTGGWSIQIGAEYASTWYRFARDPEGVYSARAARDEVLSAQTSIRLDLD